MMIVVWKNFKNNYKTMSRRISEKFNTSKKNAERLVRTEINYVHNQATADSYKDAGVEKYQFLATLDSRTSDTCASLNGEIFEVKDMAVGINYPPMHPRCRSTTIPIIDYDLKSEKEEFTEEDRSAIMRYIGAESYILNEALRNDLEISKEQKEWIEALDKALDKVPNYNGFVTRSLDFKLQGEEAIKDFLEFHKIGKPVIYKSYTSTTIGDTYNPDGEIQLVIKSKTGKNISNINISEKEILFKRNTKFKVVKKKFENAAYKVFLEEMSENE